MSDEYLNIDREGTILGVTLNRPEKANALSKRMLSRLTNTFHEAVADDALHVLTIEGAGGRVFCAGADLTELSKDPDAPENMIWEEMAIALVNIPFLTIAFIGGATTLALGCDIRLAAPESVFGYPVLRNGCCPHRAMDGD